MSEWQPISTAPKQRKIVVFYRNAIGKGRTVMACYWTARTLELADDCDPDLHDYDDATGEAWASEGWYEEHQGDAPLLPLEAQPTHWMPLPEPPK